MHVPTGQQDFRDGRRSGDLLSLKSLPSLQPGWGSKPPKNPDRKRERAVQSRRKPEGKHHTMKKISIGSWATALARIRTTDSWEEVLQGLKDLNFDGVEVGGFRFTRARRMRRIRKTARNLWRRRRNTAWALRVRAQSLGREADQHRGQRRLHRPSRTAQFAHDLGIQGIRVDCVQPPTIHAEIDYNIAKERVVNTWKECSKIAADLGCYVTWEFEPGFAFNKPSDVLRIVDEVNEDNFGIEFDTCHAEMVAGKGARQHGEKETLPGGCLEMAQKLKGKINHIHLIDSDGTLHHDETSSHPPFGDGYLDFDAIIPVLLDSGCPHDWWTIDLCFWPDA